MSQITTQTAHFSQLEKDILLVVMKEDAEVDIAEVKENYKASIDIMGANFKYAVLVDGRPHSIITSEGRQHASTANNYVNVIAQAVVVNSLASKILANFLIRVSSQNVVMKLFTNYDEALYWLKDKIKNHHAELIDSSATSIK